MLSKPFDLSLGLAQIKPVTALTALKVCRERATVRIVVQALREVPKLASEWKLAPMPRPPVNRRCYPHAAPRSNAFGVKVAEVTRAGPRTICGGWSLRR